MRIEGSTFEIGLSLRDVNAPRSGQWSVFRITVVFGQRLVKLSYHKQIIIQVRANR